MKYILFFTSILFVGCNWAKEKTKATINKTGEVVAKTGSEFISGVSKGIENTFKNDIDFPEEFKQQGLELGKIIINSSEHASDNILSIYFIFNKNFKHPVSIKVIDEQGQEFGRVTQNIEGQKGEAKYIDFEFDKRTKINSKTKLIFSTNE